MVSSGANLTPFSSLVSTTSAYEPVGNGYQRIVISQDNSGWITSTSAAPSGWQLVGSTNTWSCSGGDWTQIVTQAFITDGTYIIAYFDLKAPRTLLVGDSEAETIIFSLNNSS